MQTHPAPRRGNIWLWTSALLFALFAMLAVAVYIAEYDEIILDQGEKEALTSTEFVRPTPPPTPDLNWPQWRGRNRDGVAWTSAPLDSLPDKALWEEPAGRGFGSCAVVGDRFYAMQRDNDQEIVLCRNAITGKEIWRHSYATPWPRGIEPDYGHGPRSTPTVVDGFVYTLGITGILQCRKADQGDLVWQKELLAERHRGAEMGHRLFAARRWRSSNRGARRANGGSRGSGSKHREGVVGQFQAGRSARLQFSRSR